MAWLSLAVLAALAGRLGAADSEYPCDPAVKDAKPSELVMKAFVFAVKQAGGALAKEAADNASAFGDLNLDPAVTYFTTQDPGALQATFASLIKGAGSVAFPELSVVVDAGDIVISGARIAVEDMYDEGQRQQFEATILGGRGSPLGTINNLYAEVPFFTSGPVTNRGITPQNFGAKVRSEPELRELWFNYYGNHLKGAGLGMTPSARAEVDEQLKNAFPTLLQYWKVERVPVVLRQLRVNYADRVARAVKEKKTCDELLNMTAPPSAPSPSSRTVPGRWVLSSIEMKPGGPNVWNNPDVTWDFSKEGVSATLKLGNGDRQFFAWSEPPASIRPGDSFVVSISAKAMAVKGSRSSAVIGVAAYGFDSELDGKRVSEMRADALAESGQSVDAGKVFKLTPRAGGSEISYEIHCGVHHIYKYKLGQ